MKWMRFKLRTNVDAEDIVISSMEDIGLYGAQTFCLRRVRTTGQQCSVSSLKRRRTGMFS